MLKNVVCMVFTLNGDLKAFVVSIIGELCCIVLLNNLYYICIAIQCENGTFYDSCIPRCSRKSCDDYASQTIKSCDDKFCIEGKLFNYYINL